MPIGDTRTHDGITYVQQGEDEAICSIFPCSICYVETSPPRPTGEPVPIPSTGSARAPKPAYIHPIPPSPGVRVTHRNAKCYHCAKYARSERPVTYCDAGSSTSRDLRLVCEPCRHLHYRFCQIERVHVHRESTVELSGGEYYSYVYAVANFHHNAEDGEWYRTREEATAAAEARRRGPPTYSYHETNPVRLFGWPAETLPHELCFGVELEMEHKTQSNTNGQAALSAALGGRQGGILGVSGKYMLARDGSLNSSGVELITSPYTLGYHQQSFGWGAVLATVKSIGKSGKGTEACGMHVHCNRLAISALTLGKMLVFVNHPANKILINRIAQRDSAFARKNAKKAADGKRLSSEKYEALHITSETIECRIFRGNLRPERVLKNIEFCHALINYCMVASVIACHDHADFISWLGANRGMYKHLVRFLAPHHGYKLTTTDSSEDI